MPAPTTKTPKRIERMLAMYQDGASAREIARALGGLSHVTVTKWLHDAGLKPGGGNGHGAKKAAARVDDMSSAMAEAQRQLAELASRPPPKDYAGVLERMRANFGLAAAFVEFQFAQAQVGRTTMTEVEKAVKIQDAFAVKIRELTPREEPDPEESVDASNAAAALIQKVMSTVQAARKNARCVHCGRNPHG